MRYGNTSIFITTGLPAPHVMHPRCLPSWAGAGRRQVRQGRSWATWNAQQTSAAKNLFQAFADGVTSPARALWATRGPSSRRRAASRPTSHSFVRCAKPGAGSSALALRDDIHVKVVLPLWLAGNGRPGAVVAAWCSCWCHDLPPISSAVRGGRNIAAGDLNAHAESAFHGEMGTLQQPWKMVAPCATRSARPKKHAGRAAAARPRPSWAGRRGHPQGLQAAAASRNVCAMRGEPHLRQYRNLAGRLQKDRLDRNGHGHGRDATVLAVAKQRARLRAADQAKEKAQRARAW
jgi:hypothetical protein